MVGLQCVKSLPTFNTLYSHISNDNFDQFSLVVKHHTTFLSTSSKMSQRWQDRIDRPDGHHKSCLQLHVLKQLPDNFAKIFALFYLSRIMQHAFFRSSKRQPASSLHQQPRERRHRSCVEAADGSECALVGIPDDCGGEMWDKLLFVWSLNPWMFLFNFVISKTLKIFKRIPKRLSVKGFLSFCKI